MEIPTFIYNVIPSKKREELISKRNVRVIKEFLKKREQIMISREDDLAHLNQLLKDKSINESEYRRLEKIMVYGHEQRRIELIRTSVGKSIKISNSSASYNEQASNDDNPSVSSVENNWWPTIVHANTGWSGVGLSGYRKTSLSKKRHRNSLEPSSSTIVPIPRHSHMIKEDFASDFDSLKEEEQKLLVEKNQLLYALDQVQLKSDNLADKKNRLLVKMEKNLLSKLDNNKNKSGHMLFSVVTWGSSWTDGLVFTVMAENEVWAEDLVRQWLNSNGRENHKIDKVRALMSQDVRGIINVGAILFDV